MKEVIATVALFPTDIHSHSLGKGKSDDTLKRVENKEIDLNHEVLCIFGKQDNHIPLAGRRLIYDTCTTAGVNLCWVELNAQHAFIRDEFSKGRYDPALANIVQQLTLELFERKLKYNVDNRETNSEAKQQEVKPNNAC